MHRGRVMAGPLMREARLSQDCDPNSNELSTCGRVDTFPIAVPGGA